MPHIDSIDRSIRILIVDDHAVTRELIRTILRSVGFQDLTQAENGSDAMKRLQQDPYDLIICDWNMPICTGLELLKMVRENPKTNPIPFLMLTAEAYRESVKAAIEAGVTDYIAKPFTAEILLNKIGKVVNQTIPPTTNS